MRQQASSRATIFDVAQKAQVSIKTVSRVVNREPNVRAKTRERVQQAITDLQYTPDNSARNLARQRSHLIGLIYDDPSAYELPSSGYIIRMQQGALQACRAAMHELLIHPCDFRVRGVGDSLKRLIADARLAGVVVAAPLSNMKRIVDAIRETNVPFVRVSPGQRTRSHRCVSTNDAEVCAEMIDHLASLGHRKIGFVKGDETHVAVSTRFAGFEAGMRRNGLNINSRHVAVGNNSFESGEKAGVKLLDRVQRPTAIFCANDDMAAGVVRTAQRMGIAIPDELSISGFDDVVLARQIEPQLTTVRQPLARMTELAVEMLLSKENKAHHQTVPAEIVVRDSTGPAPD